MRRSIVIAVLAMGASMAPLAGASAQSRLDTYVPPIAAADPTLRAASVAGAVYIPGVGFRYVTPGSRVYGWTSRGYGPRVYGYRAQRRACRDRDWLGFDRCRHGWW